MSERRPVPPPEARLVRATPSPSPPPRIAPETLADGVVRVRPFEPGDVEPMFEAARESIAEVFPWLPWCHPEYSRENSAGWVGTRAAAWESGEEYSFVIEDAATGRFLGGTGLNQIHRVARLANLGYWVRTSAAGRGAATRATRLVARFGLERLALARIEILAAVDNRASQRVAEKAGAVREGVLRNRLQIHGRSVDAVIFSLVPGDLAASDVG